MTKCRSTANLVLLSFVISISYRAHAGKEESSRYTLIRAVPRSSSQLRYLYGLTSRAYFQQVDFWRFSGTLNDSCDLMIDEATLKNLTQEFKHKDINYTIVIPDVEQLISNQAKRKRRRQPGSTYYLEQPGGNYFNLGTYHSYDEICGFMNWAESSFPHLAKIHTIGYTHEKRPIQLLQLLENYDRDASVRAYVDLLTWYILPVVNPDGYEFSRASFSPRNRNFDFNWGAVGCSNDPCDEIYHGSKPFSEPETEAIRRFITNRSGEFVSFLTLHSYSQMWMYPYGHKRQAYSSDVRQLRAVALRATQALYNVYKTRYEVGTGADLLYPASGGSEDWAKGVAGIKYSYLLELRPHKDSPQGFLLDESEIMPTGKETWEGIRCVADAVISTASSTAFTSTLTTLPMVWCQDMDPFLCRWWAANGGCHMVPSTALRCPRSCRIC
ncbi:hypothetical protein D918_03935 [Trichuris suis]|nr:hypothetical protein D918_03935 [Trichuris suis]